MEAGKRNGLKKRDVLVVERTLFYVASSDHEATDSPIFVNHSPQSACTYFEFRAEHWYPSNLDRRLEQASAVLAARATPTSQNCYKPSERIGVVTVNSTARMKVYLPLFL